MPYHFRHNLDDGERLSVVDSDRGAEHLRENDHVSLMGADGFALPYLLQKLFLIFREFSLELSALTRRKELSQSIELQVLELLRGMPLYENSSFRRGASTFLLLAILSPAFGLTIVYRCGELQCCQLSGPVERCG